MALHTEALRGGPNISTMISAEVAGLSPWPV